MKKKIILLIIITTLFGFSFILYNSFKYYFSTNKILIDSSYKISPFYLNDNTLKITYSGSIMTENQAKYLNKLIENININNYFNKESDLTFKIVSNGEKELPLINIKLKKIDKNFAIIEIISDMMLLEPQCLKYLDLSYLEKLTYRGMPIDDLEVIYSCKNLKYLSLDCYESFLVFNCSDLLENLDKLEYFEFYSYDKNLSDDIRVQIADKWHEIEKEYPKCLINLRQS